MKKCRICNIENDLESFNKDKHKYLGVRNECKPCRSSLRKDIYANRPEEEIHKDKEFRSRFYLDNKEQCSEKSKKYYAKNSELIKERTKEYYWENREKIAEYCKKYQKEHPEKSAAINKKRRIAKRLATPKWLTKDQKIAIKAIKAEAQIKTKILGIKFEMDHIIPIQGDSVCGLNVPWNLRVLPKVINAIKGKKMEIN